MAFTPRTSDLVFGSAVAMSATLAMVAGADGADESALATSSDGITWTPITSPIPGEGLVMVLAYSADLDMWLAGGYLDGTGETIFTSVDDGGTWTPQTSPFDSGADYGEVYAACWSPGLSLWVAGGYSDSGVILATSPDGVTWTAQTTGQEFEYLEGISWSPMLGLLAGVIYSNDVIITSPDGVVWTPQTTPWTGGSSPRGYAIAWSPANGVFVAVGRRSSFTPRDPFIYSVDGTTWLLGGGPDTAVPNGVVEVRGGLILSVGYGTIGDETAWASNDAGVTWEAVTTPFDGNYIEFAAYSSALGFTTLVGQTPDDYSIATGSAPISVSGPVVPLWRYFVADLDGSGITDFSKLASSRVCEVTLNAPLLLSGTVPSDDPQVWIPYDGDGYSDPYLSEGTRLLWGFRRESNTPPYYVVRAATLVQLVEDEAQQDDATTSFTGWDPWHYLMSRPVMNSDGDLPGKNGMSFSNTQASTVIASLLKWTIDAEGFTYIDAGEDWSGSSDYTGTLEEGVGMSIDINFQQGTSVGQAWRQVTDMGFCDIVLEPIYVPTGRMVGSTPVYNFLCQLNVYAEAGDIKDEQIFAWNLPGRSLVGLSRQFDGSSRANYVAFQAGQGGAYGYWEEWDSASIAKYGSYWAQQFFPGATGRDAHDFVVSLVQEQLSLRARGRETVTFRPAPDRSPRPWQDYSLGDRVPVWASAQKFRQVLGESNEGTMAETQYQRIYGWRANISDDALETIDPVLTSPQTGSE